MIAEISLILAFYQQIFDGVSLDFEAFFSECSGRIFGFYIQNFVIGVCWVYVWCMF